MIESSFGGTLLRFRALGIPVRVEAGFLVTTLVLGAARLRSVADFVGWLAVVFVSVLVHELGHAVVARAFGFTPDVRLYTWGGVTTWTTRAAPGPLRHLAISLAGPFVGILLGLACWALKAHVPLPWARRVLQDFVWASGVWGAINLIPILPLDGGQALHAVIALFAPSRAEQAARVISALAGFAAAAVAMHFHMTLIAVFAAWMGMGSARQILDARRAARDEVLIAQMTPVFAAAIDARDGAALCAAARAAALEASLPRARTWVAENIAVGEALRGDIPAAVEALAAAWAEQPPSPRIEGFVVRTAIVARKLAMIEGGGVRAETVLAGTTPEVAAGEDAWVEAAAALRLDGSAEVDAVVYARAREAAEILGRDADAARLGEVLLLRGRDPDLVFAVACAWGRAGEERAAEERAREAVALGFRDWERGEGAPEVVRRGVERGRAGQTYSH